MSLEFGVFRMECLRKNFPPFIKTSILENGRFFLIGDEIVSPVFGQN